MQAIHQVIHDAPEFIPVPLEFQHRSIELIIKPLEDSVTAEGEGPAFQIADVDHVILPSRGERNARR